MAAAGQSRNGARRERNIGAAKRPGRRGLNRPRHADYIVLPVAW